MEKISEHISYKEAVRSITAIRYGINNVPTTPNLRNMIMLAEKIFEPLRAGLGGKPIHIASFFRCKDLNDMIGGSVNSQHMADNGAAMDIDGDFYGVPGNKQIYDYIAKNLEFDQLIWEFGDEENPEWVHVSFNEGKNRGQKLKAIKLGRITKYLEI